MTYTDEELAILNGVPVGGAQVAEALTPEEAKAAVLGFAQEEDGVTPAPNVATDPGDTTVYPGDFTDEDRAKITVIYNNMVQFAPAMAKIIEFAAALTPEVQEDAKAKLGNPLAQRLMRNLLPKGLS
jgi:hypothetical protein